jgi:hypothetical protein
VYAELQESVLNGEFLAQGRWRIRYLPLRVGIGYPGVEPNHKLITGSKQPSFFGRGSWPDLSSSLPVPRLWLDAEEFTSWLVPGGIRPVLTCCWVPCALCADWFKTRKIDVPPWLADALAKQSAESAKSKPRPEIKDKRAGVDALMTLLRERADNVTVEEAFRLCRESNPLLSRRGFHARVWPNAREAAGLSPRAPAGRKPKSPH